jgi:hypothetical protein
MISLRVSACLRVCLHARLKLCFTKKARSRRCSRKWNRISVRFSIMLEYAIKTFSEKNLSYKRLLGPLGLGVGRLGQP